MIRILHAVWSARFDIERAVFLNVPHRLFDPGSDRAADKWKEAYRIDGAEELRLHQLYRAMFWLGEELAEQEQSGRTPFAARCTKNLIEEWLFQRRRDLFSTLELVFFDTTSLYFEGRGGAGGKGLQPRPSARSGPDGGGGGHGRAGRGALLRDVAGQHRRGDLADPRGGSSAQALRNLPGVHRGRQGIPAKRPSTSSSRTSGAGTTSWACACVRSRKPNGKSSAAEGVAARSTRHAASPRIPRR